MTTVPGVEAAFDKLRELATHGEPYRMDQVFFSLSEGTDPATIFGNGYDFTQQFGVPDLLEGQTVPATSEFRVIACADGSLFVRQRLTWKPSDDLEHSSYASYQISRQAAERLAATDVEAFTEEPDWNGIDLDNLDMDDPDSAAQVLDLFDTSLSDTFDSADAYRADWKQTVPGLDGIDLEADTTVAETHAKYHSQVIRQLNEADTPVTCMLSNVDLGVVHPRELPMMAEWLESKMRVAS